MSAPHVEVDLASGLDTLTRVVARLHQLRIDPSALRYDGSRLCLNVPSDRVRRLVTVLERLPDVRLVSVSAACRAAAPAVPAARTSYAVARTRLAVAQ